MNSWITSVADLVGVEHVGLGLDFVKDDEPLHPDDELFNAHANKLLPGLENEKDLRKAFQETMKDPELLADAAKSKLEIEPVPAEELEKTVAGLCTLSPSLVTKLRKIFTVQ